MASEPDLNREPADGGLEGFRRTAIERAAELKTRFFFAAIGTLLFAFGVSPIIGVLWGAAVVITQAIDHKVNAAVRDVDRVAPLTARERWTILINTTVATYVYGAAGVILWFGFEGFGPTSAILVMCGALIHVVIHMHHDRALFLSGFIPHTSVLIALPALDFAVTSQFGLGRAVGFFVPIALYIGHLVKAYKRNRASFLTMVAERETARQQRLVAETANSAKDGFLAMMSHELRTPLNGVLGAAQALQRTPLDDEQRKLTGVLASSGNVLLTVINDILDYSKIEANRLDLEDRPVCIRDLLADAEGLWAESARAKGLDFSITSDLSPDYHVYADPTRLRQILFNLLSNAVKFTATGSVAVIAEERDGSLIFSVEDAGCGVPADRAPFLFEAFVQADASTTRRYGGTGLGLSICRRLARLMGGDVVYAPRDGGGSIFTVAVPARRAPEIRPVARDAATGGLDRMRVLLAEDNDINRLVVASLLKGEPIDLVMVENGEEALAALAEEALDLVLMDVQMPVLDGVDATLALRARSGPNQDVPVVALTANVMRDQVDRYLKSGVTDHLAKPVRREALIAILARYAGARHSDVAEPPRKTA
ncbi:MAG: ATP-binding protein [Pseudomonadota bacterium]